MLDIKFIRENRDIVESAIKNKNREINLDDLIELSDRRKALKQEVDGVNQKRNEAAKSRDVEAGGQLKKELELLEKDYDEVDKKFISMMVKVPNIPSLDTPIGKDDTENKVVRKWGELPSFSFKPKEHDDIGKALGIIDIDTAGEISGSRFAYLKGDLVLMQFALLQHCFGILTNKEKLEQLAKNVNLPNDLTSFTPIIPPVFIKTAVQNRMARFMTPDEHYMFPNDDLMLIGSAEHTMGSMHMDQIIDESKLPLRYVGYSTAFRREAGSHGRDTKGIIRQHQFDKLEMETFCLPEHSIQEQDFLVAIQEHILQSLGLPYQVVAVCTGDMGFPDYRQIDIETWMPGQNKYRETHSADLTTSFQSRRLNTRVKRADGKIEPLHMNDATAIAIGRTLVAIIENYQNEDGSIRIPEVLQPYMGGQQTISKK
ncbi:MAG: serine--tRNA ligase [Candidatus Zambryskibacteria bacterium RIFOXYD1_FULL_40_13]|nr:MAG: Serine-tRNA ligase [Parcubacteria group bacterium GW2011_GWC1_39_12]KKR19571.1 MAG: Serine-tRNA ligase [Parcubacteria group bacterium GW2011_GWF1_39_37]KKR35725.1 MAG: Serine-tRNA ligase [Parcubacteria group bacterium GW2011_GWC2_40_10]KKR52539.1 MAG: Serine-tRNA ligase [Parcubacteria group bacterium GW2011_GWE1_40_20]KKR68987.1 MAG: Serine-tRNA ligase [Parcubacteria group bacterium GW2011_GWF2_40_69]KKR81743.1 MAG: Serine-tRNA ligase [Parcubacteria group bacterium GW2011_GWD1_40_9]KK